MIEIEFEEPKSTTCECCGNTSTSLTRFVYQDNCAFAVYYVSFTQSHKEKIAYSLVGLGSWGENDPQESRRAFALKIWQNENEWAITLTDSEESPWAHTKFLGKILNKEEALVHPWVKDVFHITDHIVSEDQEVIEYFATQNL